MIKIIEYNGTVKYGKDRNLIKTMLLIKVRLISLRHSKIERVNKFIYLYN